MMKHSRGLSDRTLCWEVCPSNRAASCFLLCLALGIMVTTVTSSGCGQSSLSQRVMGGKNSVQGKWPWQVSLVYDKSHVCGGSLVSPSWVVSAAHCMSGRDPSLFYVMMGILNLTGQLTTRVIIPVKEVFIHPMYRGEETSGDLVLLELKKPVTFTNNIHPICLPSLNQHIPDGTMCWLVGWGNVAENVNLDLPYTLQEVDLLIINSSACDKMYGDAYNLPYPPEIVKDDMICAGYPNGGKDGCQGDSGGPLACQSGNAWLLIGIVSWGDGCGKPGNPGVYTKVSSFVSWIQDHIKLNATVPSETRVTTTEASAKTVTATGASETQVTVTAASVNTFTTQKTSRAVHDTPRRTFQEGPTGAGLRPHTSWILLAVVFLIGRILDAL